MPTFTDATVPAAANLNALVTGINSLGVLATGIAATRQVIPASHMYVNTPLSVVTGADTVVSLPAVTINEDNLWVASVGHMTINTAGVYIAWAQVNWDGNTTGQRAGHILLNGTSVSNAVAAGATNTVTTAGVGTCFVMMTPPMSLAVGAQIYLSVFQNTGANLNLIPNESGTYLAIMRLGA
jgi:hypothetical protein